MGGQQRGDDLRVGGAAELHALLAQLACSSTALIRLPLWASATWRLSERHTGWAFSHADEPVVE